MIKNVLSTGFIVCYTPGMRMIITDISALEYWRSPLSDLAVSRQTCRAYSPPLSAPISAALKGHALVASGMLSLPIHVLTLDDRRKGTPWLVVHQAQSLPVGSLRRVFLPNCDDEVFATSPELTFVTMASHLSFAQTVHLGYELCGTHAPDNSELYGTRDRPPLSTPTKIASFLDDLANIRGKEQAAKTLPHVLTRSASPRESTLAALVTLPYMRGGSSMPHPLMNEAILLGKRNRWTTDRSYFRCDLLWPEHGVAVEYDSTLCHTGAERIAQDASRRNALESLGLTVVTATWKQVSDYREYNRFARILAGHLHTRIRPRCSDYQQRQLALRSELLRCPAMYRTSKPEQTEAGLMVKNASKSSF